MTASIRAGSLVLYKTQPARVSAIGDKIEIELAGGRSRKVRPKDVRLLHPGPLGSLDALEAPAGDVEEAWELLQGERPAFEELAELVYGDFTPASAWATWELLREGLHFRGEPGAIEVGTPEQVAELRAERERREREQAAWDAFLERVSSARLEAEDRKRLAEVERVALGDAAHSRILRHFGVDETPEAAHRFLLRCGYWKPDFNPWPRRAGVILESPGLAVPDLPEEPRLDLTHLPAWAIDDEGNQDPDDAISIDGDRLWVHIADVAALVRPDSHLDLAARERGSNLYLPERTVTMLPAALTERLGLGLQAVSPALSIGMRLVDGTPRDIRVERTWVRVSRLSYAEADRRLHEPGFAPLVAATEAFRARRLARNAARIDLPEVSVRVVDGEVVIRPLPKMPARDLVTDAMLAAGEAVARFAAERDLPIPHAMQPPPEEIRQPKTLSEMYAYRRLFKPSHTVLHPEPHFGLGLECYARATSPLRRYADLLVHQQLRAVIEGREPLSREALAERIAGIDAASGAIRRAERQSNLHWKLIHLQRNPGWSGEAVVAALEERKAVLLIPELAMEIRMRLHDRFAPDRTVRLQVREVDPTTQDAWFRVL